MKKNKYAVICRTNKKDDSNNYLYYYKLMGGSGREIGNNKSQPRRHREIVQLVKDHFPGFVMADEDFHNKVRRIKASKKNKSQ